MQVFKNRKTKFVAIPAALLIALSTLAVGTKYEAQIKNFLSLPKETTITKVIDGDTVQIKDGRELRYVGIDAPDRGQPNFAAATEANKKLVEMGLAKVVIYEDRRKLLYQDQLLSVQKIRN